MPTTPTWLRASSISLEETQIVFSYNDFAGRDFTITLQYDCPVAEALAAYPPPAVHKLLNYLSLSQAFYFFNFDYYTEVIGFYQLNAHETAFFEDLCLSGMAEFRYTNRISLRTHTIIRGEHPLPRAASGRSRAPLHGALVTNGGGKDGAMAAQAAHAAMDDLTWFTLNLRGLRSAMIDASPFHRQISVARTFTPDIAGRKYRGHKPLNGELAMQAAVAALMERKRYIIIGNEYSANEPNLSQDGLDINHQYTKSFAFEQQLAGLLSALDLGLTYFSIVRPLYELQILRIFLDFPEYHHIFVSCNHGVRDGRWCLACAKCAFVVLGITALRPELVKEIWGDSTLLASPQLRGHLMDLVAPHINKPFECVGTLHECQLSLGMVHRNTRLWNSMPADFRAEFEPYVPANMPELETHIMGTVTRDNGIPTELQPAVFTFFAEHTQPTVAGIPS